MIPTNVKIFDSILSIRNQQIIFALLYRNYFDSRFGRKAFERPIGKSWSTFEREKANNLEFDNWFQSNLYRHFDNKTHGTGMGPNYQLKRW